MPQPRVRDPRESRAHRLLVVGDDRLAGPGCRWSARARAAPARRRPAPAAAGAARTDGSSSPTRWLRGATSSASSTGRSPAAAAAAPPDAGSPVINAAREDRGRDLRERRTAARSTHQHRERLVAALLALPAPGARPALLVASHARWYPPTPSPRRSRRRRGSRAPGRGRRHRAAGPRGRAAPRGRRRRRRRLQQVEHRAAGAARDGLGVEPAVGGGDVADGSHPAEVVRLLADRPPPPGTAARRRTPATARPAGSARHSSSRNSRIRWNSAVRSTTARPICGPVSSGRPACSRTGWAAWSPRCRPGSPPRVASNCQARRARKHSSAPVKSGLASLDEGAVRLADSRPPPAPIAATSASTCTAPSRSGENAIRRPGQRPLADLGERRSRAPPGRSASAGRGRPSRTAAGRCRRRCGPSGPDTDNPA